MASHGVVYFSLGSLMNIETLPTETILQIYSSLAKISPVKVLLKSANATKLPPGLPNNVLTLPWIPQVAVLSKRNISFQKVFSNCHLRVCTDSLV